MSGVHVHDVQRARRHVDRERRPHAGRQRRAAAAPPRQARQTSFWTTEKLLDVGRAEKASDIKFEKIERGSIPRFCKVLNARSDVSCLLYIWQGIAFVGYGEDVPEDEAEDHPLQGRRRARHPPHRRQGAQPLAHRTWKRDTTHDMGACPLWNWNLRLPSDVDGFAAMMNRYANAPIDHGASGTRRRCSARGRTVRIHVACTVSLVSSVPPPWITTGLGWLNER